MSRALAAALAVTWLGACDASSGGRDAAPNADAFAGTWNYDQPDLSSRTNVARVTCPEGGAPFDVPQVGSLVLTKTGEYALRGDTDQGCTWTFAVRDGAAVLDPPAQRCDNPAIASSYTIRQWSLALDGERAGEAIAAQSHRPGAADCEFALEAGRRTRVAPDDPRDPTAAFAGTWAYDPPDPSTFANVARIVCPDAAGGAPLVTPAPQAGTIAFAKIGDGAIEGAAEGGCVWTFAVQGNTALLSPPVQTCDEAGGPRTLTHWSIASDGAGQAEVIGGTVRRPQGDCRFLVTVGRRTRR